MPNDWDYLLLNDPCPKDGDKQMIKKMKSNAFIKMLPLFVGLMTGLLSVLFLWIFEIIAILYKQIQVTPKNFVWLPLIGGIAIAFINIKFMKNRQKNFAVLAVIEELNDIDNKKIDLKTAIIQLIANIISFGTGFPVGRFGPIAYIGGTIGSVIGYKIDLDSDEMRTLLACGIAGALSGVFNSPLLGSIFVIEVIYKHNHLKRLMPILISATTSLLVKRMLLPDIIIFPEVSFKWVSSFEAYKTLILFGLFMGTIAIIYIFTTNYIEKFLNRLIRKNYLKPLIAGLVITLLSLLHPYFFDFPFNHFFAIINNPLVFDNLVLLLLTRLIGTSVALWGTYGGTFMPGLMIGSIATGIFYQALENPVLSPEVMGILGLGAIFSGFGNAPLTATLLVFELSGHADSVMAIFILNIVTAVFVKTIAKENIYHI